MLAQADFISGWRPGQSNEDYHADTTAKSRSQIETAITDSPDEFYKKHVLRTTQTVETEPMKMGSLFHRAVLEGDEFLKKYVVAPNFTELYGHHATTPHKENKKKWYQEHVGKLVTTQKKLDELKWMTDSILSHPDAYTLLKNCSVETSGYYVDPETSLALRFRYDIYAEHLSTIADIKTTWSCREGNFSKAIDDNRYDFQLAMYAEGVYQLTGNRLDFQVLIAVENTYPYHCATYILDDESTAIGLRDYRRATRLVRACYDSGQWPRYQSKAQSIGLPKWAKRDIA